MPEGKAVAVVKLRSKVTETKSREGDREKSIKHALRQQVQWGVTKPTSSAKSSQKRMGGAHELRATLLDAGA